MSPYEVYINSYNHKNRYSVSTTHILLSFDLLVPK